MGVVVGKGVGDALGDIVGNGVGSVVGKLVGSGDGMPLGDAVLGDDVDGSGLGATEGGGTPSNPSIRTASQLDVTVPSPN